MTHNDAYRQLTRSILRHFRNADDDTIAAGMQWYERASGVCESIAAGTGHTLTQAAVATAHLSPRTRWAGNVQLLDDLLHGRPKPHWALTRQWDHAAASLTADDPLATFGRRANKTRSFAHAILGDTDAVAIDTWNERVAGCPTGWTRAKSKYLVVEDSYRRAARIVGLPARELQAVTWCQIRGEVA